MPSFASFHKAIDNQENIFSVETHSFSNLLNNAILVSRSNHNALNWTQYCTLVFVNLSIETPETCPARVSLSNTSAVLSVSIPASCINLETFLTEVFTSCPVILEKSKKFFVKSSSSFPVAPNLVFTSQIALPTVSISCGTCLNTFVALPCNSFNSSQLAPVALTISLLALSTAPAN